ncbi:MAG: MoaD/ThiS family protein [Desulfobacterales bacterium]
MFNTTQIQKAMQTHIQIKLFATLQRFMPASAENYAIEAGTSIRTLLQQIDIPEDKAKLIFIDGLKAELTTVLKGGERIGIFPPVGGG